VASARNGRHRRLRGSRRIGAGDERTQRRCVLGHSLERSLRLQLVGRMLPQIPSAELYASNRTGLSQRGDEPLVTNAEDVANRQDVPQV
jgi:hypothetical protein